MGRSRVWTRVRARARVWGGVSPSGSVDGVVNGVGRDGGGMVDSVRGRDDGQIGEEARVVSAQWVEGRDGVSVVVDARMEKRWRDCGEKNEVSESEV